MAKTTHSWPKSMVGQIFYDVAGIDVFSFCPDSNDASTPATQVHAAIRLARPRGPMGRETLPPITARFHGTDMLDAFIEALIEHRTYVFGRREWSAEQYPEQAKGKK